MNMLIKYCTLLFLIIHMGCSYKNNDNNDLVGLWENKEEKCKLILNNDNTFESYNLPLDVENDHYINFNKGKKKWNGIWFIVNKKIKLVINESHYHLDIYNGISPFTKSLCLKLVEESGGEIICLDKR